MKRLLVIVGALALLMGGVALAEVLASWLVEVRLQPKTGLDWTGDAVDTRELNFPMVSKLEVLTYQIE